MLENIGDFEVADYESEIRNGNKKITNSIWQGKWEKLSKIWIVFSENWFNEMIFIVKSEFEVRNFRNNL